MSFPHLQYLTDKTLALLLSMAAPNSPTPGVTMPYTASLSVPTRSSVITTHHPQSPLNSRLLFWESPAPQHRYALLLRIDRKFD